VANLRLRVGQFSHRGRRRANNEDWLGRFQPEDPERLADKGSLFLVADGMGGHQSGELASRLAVDQVIRHYVDAPGADVGRALRRAIGVANATLYSQSRRGSEAGVGRDWGTTMVAAVVRGADLWIANVGDSRAYLLRGDRLRQLTEDHVLGPDSGVGLHVITRALGRKPDVEVDIFPPLRLRTGDRILLCSDGLTSPLPDERIQALAGRYPPQEAAEALVRAANERGGPDNVSVVLVEVTEGGSATPLSTRGYLQEVWDSLSRVLPAEIRQRPAWVLILALLLAALMIIGLGFVLGLVVL